MGRRRETRQSRTPLRLSRAACFGKEGARGKHYNYGCRRCRKILIGLVARVGKSVEDRGKSRISTQNRKNHEMTVPTSSQYTMIL